ncbi:MAG: hypothetical protein SFU98_14450 [Leptospiraceae bacterium]|nr:hypothetical protein [Leptospiraceae bacterium]
MIKILLLFLSVCFLNCATIFSKRIYTIKVESIPQGANLTVYKKDRIFKNEQVTPAEFQVDFGNDMEMLDGQLTLRLTKEGYKKKEVKFYKTVNTTTFWNALLLPFWFIGVLIDAGTGAIWKPEQDYYNVELEKEGNSKS